MVLEGVDYSVGYPSSSQLKAAGKSFVCRYLSRDWRGLKPAELADFKANGIEIVAIYEGHANGMLGGRSKGRTDAQFAVSVAHDLGLPAHFPIYFTADFDLTVPSHFTTCDEYLGGASEIIGLEYVGLYGEYDVLKHCHAADTARWFWQTYAWSRGLLYPSSHLYQYDNYGNSIGGVDVDYDKALRPNYGQIQFTPIPVPPPVPQYPEADLPDWWERTLKQEAPSDAVYKGVEWEVCRRNVKLKVNAYPYVEPDTKSKHAGPLLTEGMRLRLERIGRVDDRDWALLREGFYVPMQKFKPRVKLY